jgi:hypothetical protein
MGQLGSLFTDTIWLLLKLTQLHLKFMHALSACAACSHLPLCVCPYCMNFRCCPYVPMCCS